MIRSLPHSNIDGIPINKRRGLIHSVTNINIDINTFLLDNMKPHQMKVSH